MTPGGGTRGERGWIEKEFRSDVPPGKRALAIELRSLCCRLKPEVSTESGNKELTQAEAAKRLHSNPSSLSRFLSGQTVPGPEFIETLYKAACSDAASNEDVGGVALEDLMARRAVAAAERKHCSTCTDLSKRIDSLTRQSAAEADALRREAAALRADVAELDAAKAGLQARLTVQPLQAPLPVPRRRRDRQRSQKDMAAARQVAAQAGELDDGGRQDAALTLLRQTTEVLSPAETTLVLLTLRQQQLHHLADNLIHIYGRDQGDQDVMQVALELHERGASDDAGAVLRAALR
ncbi:helix-turn-helix domain-containing protein [Streptomyces sp. NBC_00989]|uniref:helix-turn-helix domain-containing protein n=1 Tax=Streptomyces sp. NBC_00989 TaxID=2903705 RepID=UPI00386C121D|nr:helix-turn-helix domain-containing protein [Streptomyces sp. NBC_00989]